MEKQRNVKNWNGIMSMDNVNIQKLVEISKMYYEQGMTQENIAKEFRISRSAVSMLLTEAKNSGIIRIEIKDPSENNEELGKKIEKAFGIERCIAVPSGTYSEQIQIRLTTAQAIRLAKELMTSHSCMGIAWGNACHEFMKNFPSDTSLCDITVVPMVGMSPALTSEYQLNSVVREFAEKVRGIPHYMYAPGLVETLEDKRRIESSDYMTTIFDLWQNLDFAVLGIGSVKGFESARAGSRTQLEDLRKYPEKAVGEICARRLDIRGRFIDNDFNRKLISVTAEELLKTKKVMAIAAGTRKVLPVIGALRTGIIKYLVTDEITANAVLELVESGMLPE